MKIEDMEFLRGLDRNHPLIRPLRKREDAARKNRELLQVLKVATFEQAAQKLAEILEIPGYMEETTPRRKRGRRGRPITPTVLLEAAGLLSAERIPEIIRLLILKRVLRSLRAKEKEGPHLSIETRARQILRKETLEGRSWRPNPYYLRSADTDTIKKYAKALKEASRPKRLNEHHDSLVREMEIRYSYWRQFEPLLFELLPFYLYEHSLSDERSEIWGDLFQKCEQHYALLNELPDQWYCPPEKRKPERRIFYLIRPNGAIAFVKIRNFLHLPIIYDGGSFIEEGKKTGVPYAITEIGPGKLLGEAPSMEPPWPKYEVLQQQW